MNISSVVLFVEGHSEQLALLVLTAIGGASLVVKGLEALVNALLVFFPKLKGADGELQHVAAWLDAAAKSSFLNTMAANPKAPVPAPVTPPAQVAP